jgi:PKHD-type hydroxylase
MPIVLADLFSPAEARVLHDAAARLGWEDGALTAGSLARAVKDNEQARPGAETEAVLEKVRATLFAHPGFQAVAYPKQVARMLVTRTAGGGQYGDHVDNALIGGARADVSFTLFLSDPITYEGGALTITDRVEDRSFKLGAGEAIVYPSDSLHRVEPVSSGERLVVVGWIESWVREPARREVLFDLWRAIEACRDMAQAELLSKTRSNLIRMWAG